MILVTQEAEIRRFTVQGQPRTKNSLQDAISVEKKLGKVTHTCHPSEGRKLKIGGSLSRLVWAKREILSPK
jgi:hypothetical protein